MKFRNCLAVLTLFLVTLNVSLANNIQFLDKALVENLRKSVFEIVVPKIEIDKIQYIKPLPFEKLSFKERNEQYYSVGTAFFINEHDLVSAAHVLNLQYFSLLQSFFIRDASGNVFKIRNLKGYSTQRDMVIFDLESYPSEIIPLNKALNSDIGDTVFSVGNAQGEGISFRAGQIASFTVESMFGKWKEIRFTSPASPGNSGGPLLNIEGQVLGVILKKNNNENYNYAIPIEELDNLSKDAQFFQKDVAVYFFDQQNSVIEDWNDSFKLPSKLSNIARQAQDSLDSFYNAVHASLYKKYENIYYPLAPRFRSYLRDQLYIRNFGVLMADADFKTWTIKSSGLRRIPIDEGQDVSIGRSDIASLHAVIEKPSDTLLSDFVDSPRAVLDNLLKVLPLSRTMGVEKIKITNLGVPEKTELWKDKLGRKWILSQWFLSPFEFITTQCLPYPKGMICNIDTKQNFVLKSGYSELVKNNLNGLVIGYEGGIKDWIDYFSLDDKYLPVIFKNTSLNLTKDLFEFNSDEYSLKFADSNLSDESFLHFHLGFSNEHIFEEDLLLFELFPQKGSKSHYRIQKFFSPTEFSDDKYKVTWKEIVDQSGDFSGTAVTSSESKKIRNVMKETERSYASATEDKVKQIYVIGCNFKISEDMIDRKCNRFKDGTFFKVSG